GALVVARVVEADRERLDRTGLPRAGGDDAGIDPAGEEHAQRHVRNQLPAHRACEEFAGFYRTARRDFARRVRIEVVALWKLKIAAATAVAFAGELLERAHVRGRVAIGI